MTGAIDLVGVIVPARNEESTIRPCLQAIRAARAHLRCAVDQVPEVRIVVVLDSCTDRTAEIVAAHHDVEAVAAPLASVGAARTEGVRHLLRRRTTPPERVWLANTDADSQVPAAWLTAMVRAARAGAHLVLGTAVPAPAELPDPVERAWHQRHRLRDDHPHVHGANLGIRADCYFELGGWTSLATGEDVLLAGRAQRAALQIVRTAAIPVATSTRTTGRAPRGFAHYLDRLVQDGEHHDHHDAASSARPDLHAEPLAG